MNFASVNGIVVPAGEARVSVLDNGFAFGDSVYEVMRTYGGQPVRAGAPLPQAARLGVAARASRCPAPTSELLGQVEALLAKAGPGESYVRIVVSRGVGDCSYDFEPDPAADRRDDPEAAARATPPGTTSRASASRRSTSAATTRARSTPRSSRATCSTTSWRCARRRRAAATSRCCSTTTASSPRARARTSSSCWEGALLTPPLSAGILAGITREVVLELAASLGTPCHQKPLHLDALLGADEAFITSTTREIVPVRQVDDDARRRRPPGALHLPADGRVPRLRTRALRPGGAHCRRHPVRPNQRLTSSRGTRTSVGRPCGQSVRCRVSSRSRTIAPICSSPSGWPARTAEWQASVAASRSRAPLTAQSAASRSSRSRRIASSAGPGVARAEHAPARRAAAWRRRRTARRRSPARAGASTFASSTGRRRGGSSTTAGDEQPLRLDQAPARALEQPLEAHALVRGVLVDQHELVAVARDDVDEAVLAEHDGRRRLERAAPGLRGDRRSAGRVGPERNASAAGRSTLDGSARGRRRSARRPTRTARTLTAGAWRTPSDSPSRTARSTAEKTVRAVGEANLGLGRVDVHVHEVRRQLHEQERLEAALAACPRSGRPRARPSTARDRGPRGGSRTGAGSAAAAAGGRAATRSPAPPPTPCRPRRCARSSSSAAPKSWKSRAARPSTGGVSITVRPPERSEKPVSGRASASSVTASATCDASVDAERRNLRRAGSVPNRSRTSTVVPRGWPTSRRWRRRPWAHLDLRPGRPRPRPASAAPARRRPRSTAAPRRGSRGSRSAAGPRARAAWRWRGARARARRRPALMPWPSSRTRTSVVPPSSISTWTLRAPASSAFSTSSLTTDAGRSTTSPAAILLTRSSGRRWTAVEARPPGLGRAQTTIDAWKTHRAFGIPPNETSEIPKGLITRLLLELRLRRGEPRDRHAVGRARDVVEADLRGRSGSRRGRRRARRRPRS